MPASQQDPKRPFVAPFLVPAELSPPVAPDSTWPRVKPLLWRDYRYLALAEGRRRALFDEMHAVVCEQARQEAEARAVKVRRVHPTVGQSAFVRDPSLRVGRPVCPVRRGVTAAAGVA